jgi:protein pelota
MLQAMDNFYQTVYQAILRLLPYQDLKAIVIASPGFTKDSVRSFPFVCIGVAGQ